MAFTFKLASCLCYFVVCLGRYEAWASLEIERGEYDTFRNLLCNQPSKSCTRDQCQSYRAECADDQCVRCRCSEDGRNTFVMSSDSNTGNCTKDEDIIPESVPERSFRLEKRWESGTYTNLCLTVAERGNDKLFGKGCASSSNMRWIATMRERNKFQLMNVMTLQCVEFLQEKSLCESNEHKLIGKVAMKQCNKNDGQYIPGQHRREYIHTRLCTSKSFYLRLKTVSNSSGEYPAFSRNNRLDSWKGLHWENVTYRGCYRFNKNERFMLYLDNGTTCPGNSCSYEFSAPIFNGNENCSIQWSDSKILYSGSATWQNVLGNTEKQFFSIQEKSNDTKILMVNQRALQEFHGSLLRLAISCGGERGKNEIENQCLLLKFKFTGTESPALETMNLPQDETTTMNLPEDETTTTESRPTTVKLKHEDTEESSTHSIAIAVPLAVLAIILVVVLLYFACYRKQKRKHNQSNDQDQNQLSVLVPLDRREPSTNIQPFQPYEEPCKHQYEYVDKTVFTLPQPFTYDYATGDKALKHDREFTVAPKKMASHVMRIPHTERKDTHDRGYVIEKPDTEGDIQDDGYVIERPDTEGGDIQDGGYVIERPDTEGDIEDGGYVIERPDTEEGDIDDEGYVIERPDTEQEDIQDEGYVIERPDTEEVDTQDGGYVIERPDMEVTNPHDDYVVRDESNTSHID